MTKEEFLIELEKNLKYLKKRIRKEELQKYEAINCKDLDPVKEANKIYENHNTNIRITKNIKFFDAIKTIINIFEKKEKDEIKNIILFFLSTFFIIIIIKIPFIYVRDMVSNIFSSLTSTDSVYNLWYLLFELLYAITAIIIFIKKIKKRVLEIEKK